MAQQTGTTSESSWADVMLICLCALHFSIEGKRVASWQIIRSHICSAQLKGHFQNFWFDCSNSE